jgi:hypothetical protein
MQCKRCEENLVLYCPKHGVYYQDGSDLEPKFNLVPVKNKAELLALPHKANLLFMHGKDVYAGSFWKGMNSIGCNGILTALAITPSEQLFEDEIEFKRGKLVYYKTGFKVYHLKV